jgi:8-oxo-dGTP pyrophosphatase MutT (NUDIX family)
MWLFTTFGFFSIVRKREENELTIRSRTHGDLVRLIATYLPDLGEPIKHQGTDYPWRVRCQAHQIAKVVEQLTQEIEYDNFKNEVSDILGSDRALRYGKVWQALYGMTDDAPEYTHAGWDGLPWPQKVTGKKAAFGGVVVDPTGRFLLREVANHYDGYVWTFAKGHSEAGETPRHTALREVFEETGVRARILRPLTPSFQGGTTVTHHFLMVADPEHVNLDFSSSETAGLRWANAKDAHGLISLTKNSTGRARDLQILQVAEDAMPPTPLRRPIARREDWKFKPMPARRASLPYQRVFTPLEMKQVVRGFLPVSQEQKWCIVFQNNTLHVHRSWTGIEVFRLVLEPAPGGHEHWRVRQVALNTLDSQCKYGDDKEALDALRDVVDGWLLRFGEDPGKDSMAMAFEQALGPQYLGSPKVVGQLVHDYLTVIAKMALHREATFREVMEAAERFTAAFVDDEDYTHMPWHSREQLGELLVQRMGLNVAYCADESLAFVVSESAASMSNSVRQICDGYCKDAMPRPEALFELLENLESFVVDVYLGTIAVTHPKQVLGDFAWEDKYPESEFKKPHSECEMSDVESMEHVLIQSGVEGGCISLMGKQVDGSWLFRVETNESGMLSMLNDDDREDLAPLASRTSPSWIKTWRGALKALDKYPWQNFYPLTVHPAFKAKVMTALKRRLPVADEHQWSCWNSRLRGSDGN